jgi:hypothetical protein
MKISLSLDGKFLLDDENGWKVEIPVSFGGASLMAQILKARQDGENKLASAGAPTQRTIDAITSKPAPITEEQIAEFYRKKLPGYDQEIDI